MSVDPVVSADNLGKFPVTHERPWVSAKVYELQSLYEACTYNPLGNSVATETASYDAPIGH